MRTPDYPSANANGWNAVDNYFARLLVPDEEGVLSDTLAANAKAGLPAHDVSPLQGQLLALIVQIAGAQRILEIGTLGGYSTICMARAISSRGAVVTLEADPKHAEVAQANFERAGLTDRIELCIGQALEILPKLNGPFDLIFIDADKPNNPEYLRWALALSRPSTVIVGDNVVRGGAVVNAHSRDPKVKGVRSFLDIIATEPRLTATAIQTVGEKGWDGFVLARIADEQPNYSF